MFGSIKCSAAKIEVVAGVAYPTAVIVALAGLIRQIRFLVYSHGEDVACVHGSCLRGRLLRWALGRSLGVATNSNFTRAQVIALGIAEERVECVPPGTDLERFQAVDAADVRALRTVESEPIVVSGSTGAPAKLHDRVKLHDRTAGSRAHARRTSTKHRAAAIAAAGGANAG